MKAFEAPESHAASTPDMVPTGGQNIAPFSIDHFPNVSPQKLLRWSNGEDVFRVMVELTFVDVFEKEGHVIYDCAWNPKVSAFSYTVTK
jgi:hypothetical protein